MPLSKKGRKIKKAMQETYGAKKGKEVFFASANKGTITGVENTSSTPKPHKKTKRHGNKGPHNKTARMGNAAPTQRTGPRRARTRGR